MRIVPNNMRFPSPEYYTTFWRMTIYNDTLHWRDITPMFDPLLIWTFLPKLTFYLVVWGFHRTLIFATGAACQQMTLNPPGTWSCPIWNLQIFFCWDHWRSIYITPPIHNSLPDLTYFRIWLLSRTWHHHFFLNLTWLNIGFHGISATGVAC